MVSKRADIAVCDLSKSLKRMEVIDYTKAYTIVPLTFVTLNPGLKSRQWLTMRPFSVYVWLLMIFSFIIIAISIQLLYLNKFYLTYNRYGYNRMSTISIALAGALLQQCE